MKNYSEQRKIVNDYIASHYREELDKHALTIKSINLIQDEIGDLMGKAETIVCNAGLTFYFSCSPVPQDFQSDDDVAKAKNQELIERIKKEILEANIIEDFESPYGMNKARDVIKDCVNSAFEGMTATCPYDGWQHSEIC